MQTLFSCASPTNLQGKREYSRQLHETKKVEEDSWLRNGIKKLKVVKEKLKKLRGENKRRSGFEAWEQKIKAAGYETIS